MTAKDIVDMLIAWSNDKIWATELALIGRERRIDFWTLEPAASLGFRATAYEIKVSRGDFKRDSLEKQESAISYSDRFWYVTPPNLLSETEMPQWAGLMEVNPDGGFAVLKRAPKLEKREPDWDFVVSLMRNCGQSRRDVSLLMAQLAHYQQREKRDEYYGRLKRQHDLKRWERRAIIQRPELAA